MRRHYPFAVVLTVLLAGTLGMAQAPGPVAAAVDRIAATERAFPQELAQYQPRVETYLQQFSPDPEKGQVPTRDHYYLGVLDARRGFKDISFWNVNAPTDKPSKIPFKDLFALHYLPVGFAAMVTPDAAHFDAAHYLFTYKGEEFLGDVRCLQFDVQPRRGQSGFLGRIWAEDQGFHIVRFDGMFVPQGHQHRNLHFDSWRSLMDGHWLPDSIYVEEDEVSKAFFGQVGMKAETRFWGYDLKAENNPSDLTDVQVEGAPVRDASSTNHEESPLARQRDWEQKAADDVLARMTEAGLLSPPGPVDKVLETVTTNLEVTNHLAIDPPVRCRVMLTTPLEAYTVGHTIVVSRGLLDVLPDEPSLAMVLAHQLAHIALGHRLNPMYAFDDKMMFSDEQSFARLELHDTPAQEAAADKAAQQYLENSPYKDQLGAAGLFLEAVQRHAQTLPSLLAAQLGNSMTHKNQVDQMSQLMTGAPQLSERDLAQTAALPLAGRIMLDPFTDQLRLSQAPAVARLAPTDKLTFEITPYHPYLTRTATVASDATTPKIKN